MNSAIYKRFLIAIHTTDTNLLYEAVRKALGLCAELSDVHKLPGWRQDAHHISKFKKAHSHIQKLRRSTSKDGQKRQKLSNNISLIL